MATANFLISTGRVSTQNIHAIVKTALPDVLSEHEGLGPNYNSRRVFRQPRRQARVLGNRVPIQRKFIQIEDLLAEGASYVEAGWPVFGWLPYLAERFGDQLNFVHLVRDPFKTAASLTTHGFFAGKQLAWTSRSMIHLGDPGSKYTDMIGRDTLLSAYEKNLFHWLELNSFALECHSLRGFNGLFRFEDLYCAADCQLPAFIEHLTLRKLAITPQKAVDNHHHRLDGEIDLQCQPLIEAVVELGVRLGYDAGKLRASADPRALQETYSKKRLQ